MANFRKSVGACVGIVVISLMLGLAAVEAEAQAPAPKVTISGLVDFVSTYYRNWSGGADPRRPFEWDVTDGGQDRGWYSRERGLFTLTGEVGRSKGVWAVELDFTNGAGSAVTARAFPGTSANFDLDTDVPGFVETKWLYVETPVTGPGSLLPFVPVPSMLRAGGQPFRGHDYKFGIHASGDFPGVTLESTWAPTIRSTLTYVQIGEGLDQTIAFLGNTLGRKQAESWAFLGSVEVDVFKSLTVKPTYSYAEYDGGNCGTLNLGIPGVGGFNPNNCIVTNAVFTLGPPVVAVGILPPSGTSLSTRRHTIGGDVRWTVGGFSFQPTFLFQWGQQDIPAQREADIRAWIFDSIQGYRLGPLNIQTRVMYTPGMKAQELVQNGADVEYYQPINPGFAYMVGWSEIWTGGIDYATALNAGNSALTLRESPSYDKYGRIFLGVTADYALTPALTLKGLANVSWTDEKVDTDGAALAGTTANGAAGITPLNRGDARYLGTEIAAGFTYRFAPNVAFDLMGSYLFAGEALDHARVVGGPVKDADDVYKVSSRVRFTF